MKQSILLMALFGGMLVFSACGSLKKVEKSPIATYVMPCSECVSGDGVLRAWGSGKSDNETTAHKKAQTVAAAELAAMLSRTVEATTEDYTTALTEGLSAESKSFLNDKTKIVVNKTLKGAVIACDRWTKDEQTGQYTNYIVMELRGDEYLKLLYAELSKEKTTVDMELLQRLFMKNIEESGKQ